MIKNNLSKLCVNCKTIKAKEDFYKSSKKIDGYQAYCKKCSNKAKIKHRIVHPQKTDYAAFKKWRENNPERYRELQKKYYKYNPEKSAIKSRKRRALKLNTRHSPYTKQDVLDRYGDLCHICNLSIDLKAPRKVGLPGWEAGLHLEHVVDLSLGGVDSIENVKPAHGICNLRKPKYKSPL